LESNANGQVLDLYYLSGFYDYNASISNPISTKQIFELGMTVYGWKETIYATVRENIVIFLNGTTETFYSLAERTFYHSEDDTNFFRIRFEIDPFIAIYEQYDLTEVTGRRMLLNTTEGITTSEGVTTSVDDSIDDIYFYSVIAAHLGGIYACFHFIMSCIVAPYERKIFTHEQLNKFHKLRNAAVQLADCQQNKVDMVNVFNNPNPYDNKSKPIFELSY
jgi:hypothetical protein